MKSNRAIEVWRHDGWGAVVGWIVRRVPDCDPTIAAVHAICNAAKAASDPGYARCLAGYVRQIAQRSSVDGAFRRERLEELAWDPPEPPSKPARPTDSLATVAAAMLSAAGVRVSGPAWGLIAPSIDVAVDWWDSLAARTGLVGDDLVVASRESMQTTGNHRLRANFDGPTARPLVALLVGGDQQGRWARRAARVEAGLLYWSLQARNASGRGESLPAPPAPVCRAWATHVEWIEHAIDPTTAATAPAVAPATDPTVAA
jgi:hypothetical protein